MIHPYSKRSSQRVTITIPYTVHERVCALANKQGRSTSNLMAYLIEGALDRLDSSSPE
jgi:macrodomain Ter protein organizer (MatP/YcbG family)